MPAILPPPPRETVPLGQVTVACASPSAGTVTLRQVETLLAEGRAVGDKELREYMEVRGYADAASWVYGQGLHDGD